MAQPARPPTNPNVRDPKLRLVRLKTPNPKRGLHMLRWSAEWRGRHVEIHFDRGWYWVPVSLARYLETVPARHGVMPGGEGDEDHPRAFWIVSTIAEAKAKDEAERARDKAKVKGEPTLRINGSGGDLTTGDLHGRRYDERDEEPGDERIQRDDVQRVDGEDDDLEDQIAALSRKLEELRERSTSRVRARDVELEEKSGDGDKPIVAEAGLKATEDDAGESKAAVADDAENPDLNTPARSGRVDFRAEGDRPRVVKKKPGEEKKEAPARTTSRPAGSRSFRAGE